MIAVAPVLVPAKLTMPPRPALIKALPALVPAPFKANVPVPPSVPDMLKIGAVIAELFWMPLPVKVREVFAAGPATANV